jgi:hypothetical protein
VINGGHGGGQTVDHTTMVLFGFAGCLQNKVEKQETNNIAKQNVLSTPMVLF